MNTFVYESDLPFRKKSNDSTSLSKLNIKINYDAYLFPIGFPIGVLLPLLSEDK